VVDLNLDPNQKISKKDWAFLAQTGSIEGYKNRWLPMQRICDFIMGCFVGFVLGILIAASIDTIMRGLH